MKEHQWYWDNGVCSACGVKLGSPEAKGGCTAPDRNPDGSAITEVCGDTILPSRYLPAKSCRLQKGHAGPHQNGCAEWR